MKILPQKTKKEIIGDLTTKLVTITKKKDRVIEIINTFTKSGGESNFDTAVDYFKGSDYFGFLTFKNRAYEIDVSFGFYDVDLKVQYKRMILKQDHNNIDKYITDLIPF